MFARMNGWKKGLVYMVGATVLANVCHRAVGDAKPNPYDSIVDRNPFNLKPPPPPDLNASAPAAPVTLPAQVEVTGITSILSTKRVLLEIIPGPGKQMIKPILAEGERVESVEVLSINVDKNEVTIKNGTVVTNLTFKIVKNTAPTPPPPGAPNPSVVGSPIVLPSQPHPQQPQVPTGRNAVMVSGGSSTPIPTIPAANSQPILPTIGAPSTPGANPSDAGFRQIPSRNIRTTATPQGASAPINRQEQYLLMEANHLYNENSGQRMPPLPPTPLNPDRVVQPPPVPGR
jgi:hypothetical protein